MPLAFFPQACHLWLQGTSLNLQGYPQELSSQLWWEGELTTVWGTPDSGLCWCGQQPSWCSETSGLTLRPQGQDTDRLQITHLRCDCSSASDTRRSLGWLRFSSGIAAVLGILRWMLEVGNTSVS